MAPVVFGLLLGLAVFICFVAIGRVMGKRDPVAARLKEYNSELYAGDEEVPAEEQEHLSSALNRLTKGLSLGPRIKTEIMRADLPITNAEFTLVVLGAGALGFVLGTLRLSPLLGIVAGAVLGYLPIFYVRGKAKKRQQAFTEQLPDVLTLLVSALRAGYGLSQALQVLVEQLSPPASVEFGRAFRAISLGQPAPRALDDLVQRIGTDDAELMVTAINVQHELGGNLAQTLETIGQTVRDRIRIGKELRVMTAQQRLTSLILAVLPIGLGFILFMINPRHMSKLFYPGAVRILLIGAVVMEVMGFALLRRMLDLEV